jgi:hypothetical protein
MHMYVQQAGQQSYRDDLATCYEVYILYEYNQHQYSVNSVKGVEVLME